MKKQKTIRISVDVGGTFCDCYLNDQENTRSLKILSTGRLRAQVRSVSGPRTVILSQNWDLPFPKILSGCLIENKRTGRSCRFLSFDPLTGSAKYEERLALKAGDMVELYVEAEAPIFAAHLISGIPLEEPLHNIELRIGTTKGTNALLEKKGEPCIWITNRGYKDLLYIRTQQRPHLFQLNIPEPEAYHRKVIEIDARMNAAGGVIRALSKKEISRILSELPEDHYVPVAISLMHAYKNPEHETQLKNRIVSAGYRYVSSSHELHPAIHLLPRSETTVCNAYLSPVIHQFNLNLARHLPADKFFFISSAGQLIPAASFHASDSLLSGPAGGIRGAEQISRQYRTSRLITFDMGGTSTDTARIDGNADLRFITRIGEIQIASPSYYMESVAAGGGSIVSFMDGRFTVGPESAGALPGPACYGQGGPLTITDINLLIGKLEPTAFSIPIQISKAEKAFTDLLRIAGIRDHSGLKHKILQGILRIANEKMAEAILKISFTKGFDPAEYTLLVFGGAGGLHACALAEMLHMRKIIIPFDAGIFSARGIMHTSRAVIKIKQINAPLELLGKSLVSAFRKLEGEATAELRRNHVKNKNWEIGGRKVYLRFKGQDQVIAINWKQGMDVQAAFRAEYQRIYRSDLDFQVEVEKILVRVLEKNGTREFKSISINKKITSPAILKKKFIRWNELQGGHRFTGPCTISSAQASVFIEDGWTVRVMNNWDLVAIPSHKQKAAQSWSPAINLELFQNRFRSIAEQMGAQLQYSAFSVNVKERLDFSCAVLDDQARLLVNAPHIPVHLGSLGISARLILRDFNLDQGDIILSNHPRYGGSHLPDLTLLKAVYDDQNRLIGYVTNRAHHAEIGGMTPGSMPAFASRLEEEGVIFNPTYIYRSGKPGWKQVRGMLTQARYPSRNPQLNILDLKAAIASLLAGEKRLQSLAKTYGTVYVRKQMRRILNQGKELIGTYILNHAGARLRAIEYLDDGHRIQVFISIKEDKMTIDFTGTSGVHPGNLNANPAIVQSVVLYTLRLLCDRDISMNEGMLHHVKIINPVSFINPHFPASDEKSPAVVGGNTEVSQRLTDCLIKAFGLAACSQGTMNNFLFGNDRYTYYETIGGGTGAGPGFHGRSAIHQHMTNTKITDPEELEWRYPVRLEKFEIRRGSGGSGKWRGGNGICRQIRFLEPMTITILAQHRKEKPFGMEGGSTGKCGKQILIRGNKIIPLSSNQSFEVQTGDVVRIETPGGGGWGNEKNIK